MAQVTTAKLQQAFSFNAPSALSVILVGDFTHWQKHPISMKREKDGIWRTTVPLDGTHHYRFLVDGAWEDDPECVLRVPNPYGHNAMRMVS